jgi:anti-sigma factor RsiW
VRLIDALRDWLERRSVALTCQQVVELMTDYVEGVLLPDERGRFEAHLAHCDACARYLEQLRATLDVLAQMTPPEPDPVLREELVAFYRRYRSS